MALNKERKVFLGLLGSAGLILVVDQVLLAPPQVSQAGEAAPPPPTTAPAALTTPQPTAGTPSPSSEVVRTWNEQLGKATTDTADVAGVADPFSAAKAREPEPTGIMGPVDFEREHKLTAVLAGGDIGVAMINGTSMRIGQEIAGYRLIRVDARSAEFRAGEFTVRLMLPTQGVGGS